MVIPEYIKNEANDLGLIKHEKTFELVDIGTERITVFLPNDFKVNNDYWNQFIPDYSFKAGSIGEEEEEREYKYVGNEIVHISYDIEPKIEDRIDLKEFSGCPHTPCKYCQQIKRIETKFENGVYRLIKEGDFFSFSANANLIQATMWVQWGKGQVYSYEGKNVFMKSEIINQNNVACIWTYGRIHPRSVKFYSRPGDSNQENFSRLWCHISRYNIANWP